MRNKIGVLLGMGILFSCSLVFAGQQDAQLLREAAVALQSSNPVLSQKLSSLAVSEERESEVASSKEAESELEGKAEAKKAQYDKEYVNVLSQAASELRASKPALAGKLSALAKENADFEKSEGADDANQVEAKEAR